MAGLSGVLGAVAPVAGIGGIAIALSAWVFRKIIAREIFPQLTKTHAYHLIRLIVLCTFLLGLAGMAVWLLDRHPSPVETRIQPPPDQSTLPTKSALREAKTERYENPPDGGLPAISFDLPEGWASQDNEGHVILFEPDTAHKPKNGFVLIPEAEDIEWPSFVEMSTNPQYPITWKKWSHPFRSQYLQTRFGVSEDSIIASSYPYGKEPDDQNIDHQYELLTVSPGGYQDDAWLQKTVAIFGDAELNKDEAKQLKIVKLWMLTCKAPSASWRQVRNQCDEILDSIQISRKGSPVD